MAYRPPFLPLPHCATVGGRLEWVVPGPRGSPWQFQVRDHGERSSRCQRPRPRRPPPQELAARLLGGCPRVGRKSRVAGAGCAGFQSLVDEAHCARVAAPGGVSRPLPFPSTPARAPFLRGLPSPRLPGPAPSGRCGALRSRGSRVSQQPPAVGEGAAWGPRRGRGRGARAAGSKDGSSLRYPSLLFPTLPAPDLPPLSSSSRPRLFPPLPAPASSRPRLFRLHSAPAGRGLSGRGRSSCSRPRFGPAQGFARPWLALQDAELTVAGINMLLD
ncbi:uncharacterized protein LOC101036215 [Saimiri boliviensis]|uniref:uncharacterized protein LOC101036215 n=1 Tax=Saimiri boliviensis TaxID=27679 RepID=UPI003D786CD2